MAARAFTTHDRCTCAVDLSATEVDAGADLTVTVRASCPEGCDLSGQQVSIRGPDGSELADAALTGSDEASGPAYVTSAVTLQAPVLAGEHVYRALLAARETDGVRHEAVETAFAFVAVAHAANVNVWGVPSAIAA